MSEKPQVSESDLEHAVMMLIKGLRAAGAAAGLTGEELDESVAHTLAFLRRRLTGDYSIDEFGYDADFTESLALPLLRPLYRHWFRVEVRGIEHLPATGGGLVVANHSGTIAIDSVMTQLAVHEETPNHRSLRMLGADLVFSSPLVGPLARKTGSTLATSADAQRLLDEGHLVGVWPEGFKGVGKLYKDRYRLQRFGRGGFVAAALRAEVPIIPCSIVGAEEVAPMLANAAPLARLLGLPYFPITPTFPLLGPLGLVPLPSKWLIEFGAPIRTDDRGEGAAEDPAVVFEISDRVRETIQHTLYGLLRDRRSVFF